MLQIFDEDRILNEGGRKSEWVNSTLNKLNFVLDTLLQLLESTNNQTPRQLSNKKKLQTQKNEPENTSAQRNTKH